MVFYSGIRRINDFIAQDIIQQPIPMQNVDGLTLPNINDIGNDDIKQQIVDIEMNQNEAMDVDDKNINRGRKRPWNEVNPDLLTNMLRDTNDEDNNEPDQKRSKYSNLFLRFIPQMLAAYAQSKK